MPIDFKKLSSPEFKAAVAADSQRRREESEAKDRKVRGALDVVHGHEAYETMKTDERRFINNARSLYSQGRLLSEKQEKWLFDLASGIQPEWDVAFTARGQMAKSEIIEREGHIALVLADPAVAAWERNRVAEMTEDEGTDCWRVVDIRLKRFPQLSMYGCSTGADVYHASFTPDTEAEARLVKPMLREYREDADGSIHWCTFDGIVRGHPEVDGYRPRRYLDFDQAGYFSRDEGMAKLLEMKAFWDVYDGSLVDARIENPHRQVSDSEVQGLIIMERMNAERDRRVAALGDLEKKAGAEYTLWQFATEALAEAGGDPKAVNWVDVEKKVAAESLIDNGQPREAVVHALIAHSPLRSDRDYQRDSINKLIDAVLSERLNESAHEAQQAPDAAL